MGNGSKRHKTGCRTRLYATTGATRCPAFIPGILMDTLLRTASCGGDNLVYRSNLSRRIAEMADPSTFKPILPPLPATFSQSFSGEKDAPARGDHFPHIFRCKFPKFKKIIWFFFQNPIITCRHNQIIKLLRILASTKPRRQPKICQSSPADQIPAEVENARSRIVGKPETAHQTRSQV